MMRNDYRRSLILLRSNASGYSGHVRLERRTLMGTMYFLAQAAGDCPALRAALVGRGRDGSYYACALGELKRDERGQAVLGWSFDPRDICGRELEQYQIVALTCAGDEACEIVLFGNVCGHAELNWDSVRAALQEIYSGAAARPAAPVTELPEAGSAAPGDGGTAASAAEAAPAAQAEVSAGERLREMGVDTDAAWPEAAEPLRTLFQTERTLTDAPDGQCVYVEAPMPAESGFAFVAAGLLVMGGALAAVRYALPAAWSQEPPAGLEDYAWVGDQNRGWWVTEVPVEG